MTKTGRLSKRDRDALLRAANILNQWCDWENDERERESFDPVFDDIECNAASAAGMIHQFLYETRSM
jgi:hypothetical protein